jgi:hypothetical protein
MFIPTWLLIVIVVVILSVFWPNVWDEVRTLALGIFVLLAIVSLPATLYYAYRADTEMALMVAMPWMAMAAWGLWAMTIEGVKSSIWVHEMRVRAAASPERVEVLRRSFASGLGLGAKMWQFRDDVKHFPSWYSKTNADGTPWTSNVIGQNEIAEVRGSDDVAKLGFEPSAFKIETPFVLYSFSADGKAYAFCTRDRVEGYGRDHDSDGEPLGACGVWVVEKPARVVLSMRLAYYMGEYADTLSRESTYVEAFKPGPWLPTLLSIVDRVHQDEHEKHERWRKQWERERAKKNFT